MRRWQWLIVGLLACGSFVALPRAAAQAALVAAVPPDGAEISTAPAEIVLTFDAPLAQGSTFALYDIDFIQVPGIEGSLDGADGTVLVAPADDLPPGIYTVEYDVVDLDGIRAQGRVTFGIGISPAAAERETNWLVIIGAIVVAGAGILAGAYLRIDDEERA